MKMETPYDRILRLEKEVALLRYRLRNIAEIHLYKLKEERERAEREGEPLPEMPKWLDETLELLARD
jgi:hypothetical protein